MKIRWRGIVVAAVATISINPCRAYFLTGAEWLGMSTTAQSAYVVGVYDTLTTFVHNAEDQSTAEHYRTCVTRLGMSMNQMTDNVRVFTQARPDLHAQPMAGTVGRYLFEVCGKPPHV